MMHNSNRITPTFDMPDKFGERCSGGWPQFVSFNQVNQAAAINGFCEARA